MQIGGLQKLTLIDFPGKLACTVFLMGCNFRCPFCYSSELVLPEKIKKQMLISEKYFFDFLKERKGILGGVCICGGEPTIHKDLPRFCQKIKKLGYLVKLDTNGSNPEMLENLIKNGLIDYIAMDIKAPREKYEKTIGVKIDIKKIQKSIEIIKNSGIDYEFRTTVVPTTHNKEDILEIAKWIRGKKVNPVRKGGELFTQSSQGPRFSNGVKYYLQNFRPEKTLDPKFKEIKPYPQEFLLEIQKAIASFFGICKVR